MTVILGLMFLHIILGGFCLFYNQLAIDLNKGILTPRAFWTAILLPHLFWGSLLLILACWAVECLLVLPMFVVNGIRYGIIEGRHWKKPEFHARKFYARFWDAFYKMPPPKIIKDQL